MFLWWALGLITLYEKKIDLILSYNSKQEAINKNIVENNKKGNKELDEFLKNVTNKMSINYEEYVKQYKEQKEKELQERIAKQKEECNNLFKNYVNAVVLYPSEDYIRYIFLRDVYNNFLKDFYRRTRNTIKAELWAYWYETYYNVRKYNRDQFLKWFVFIKNPWKYNYFDIEPIPNLYANNDNINKYFSILSKEYDIKKIWIDKVKDKKNIYTDILYYYTIDDSSNVVELVKTYYKVFKKCDDKELSWDLNELGQKCGFLANKDLDKLWKSYYNSLKLKSNYLIIDDKLRKQYTECSVFPEIKKNIDSNIKQHEKLILKKVVLEEQK